MAVAPNVRGHRMLILRLQPQNTAKEELGRGRNLKTPQPLPFEEVSLNIKHAKNRLISIGSLRSREDAMGAAGKHHDRDVCDDSRIGEKGAAICRIVEECLASEIGGSLPRGVMSSQTMSCRSTSPKKGTSFRPNCAIPSSMSSNALSRTSLKQASRQTRLENIPGLSSGVTRKPDSIHSPCSKVRFRSRFYG